MEPQWNPMAEEQAIDRVHRLGQTIPVTAFRYIVKNSIDEVGPQPNSMEYNFWTLLICDCSTL